MLVAHLSGLHILETAERLEHQGQRRGPIAVALRGDHLVHLREGRLVVVAPNHRRLFARRLDGDVALGDDLVAQSDELSLPAGEVRGVGDAAEELLDQDAALGISRVVELDDLVDAAGEGLPPTGGANTGFGGTAAHGPGSPLPWAGVIGAGMLLALTGGIWLRRARLRRLTTHV